MSEVKPRFEDHAKRLNLTAPEVRNILRSLLGEVCGISRHIITEEASIEHELQMESAQLAQIQVALEDELDISLDFLEIIRLRTFGRIADYIHGQVSMR